MSTVFWQSVNLLVDGGRHDSELRVLHTQTQKAMSVM